VLGVYISTEGKRRTSALPGSGMEDGGRSERDKQSI
jgi:hypothetical protein